MTFWAASPGKNVFEIGPWTEPNAVIDLRILRAGGGANPNPKVKNKSRLRRSKKLTFLIHGFNVQREAAKRSYAEFAENIPWQRRQDFVWVYWPGDLHKSFARSVREYPNAIARSKKCAKIMDGLLAPYFDGPEQKEVRVIAHSLGCRLTLHFLDRIGKEQAKGTVSVAMVALMAAAVPEYLVIEYIGKGAEERDDNELKLSECGGDPALVLHSEDDRVLKWAFKAGSRGESTSLRTLFGNRRALGRFGIKDSLRRGKNVQNYDMKPLDHDDYWSSKRTAKVIEDYLPDRFERRVPDYPR